MTRYNIEKLIKFPIKRYISSNCTNFGPFFSRFYWTILTLSSLCPASGPHDSLVATKQQHISKGKHLLTLLSLCPASGPHDSLVATNEWYFLNDKICLCYHRTITNVLDYLLNTSKFHVRFLNEILLNDFNSLII